MKPEPPTPAPAPPVAITVARVGGRWTFGGDDAPAEPPDLFHVLHVPADSEWVPLVDCTRPELRLTALVLKLPTNPRVTLTLSADALVFLAGHGNWPGCSIEHTHV